MSFLESIILQFSDSFIYEVLLIMGAIVGILVGIKKFSIIDEKRKQKNSSPLQILKERYAKSEISDEEFDRMKKKLAE